MPEFTDIILRARNRKLAETIALEVRFYRMYLLALNKILAEYRPGVDFNEEMARELMKEIEKMDLFYGKTAEVLTKRTILDIIQSTIDAHKEAIRLVARTNPLYDSVDFSGISKEAYEDLFKRRNMGLVVSYKSLRDAEKKKVGLILERSLERMILEGDTWYDATQRIVDGLTQGDPEIRRMAKNMARKSKGLGIWLERADPKTADIEAIKRARRIAYNARRIVRTEIAHSHHEADRVTSLRNEAVKAIQWNLSPRHYESGIDICDVYAKADLHGLGEGVYPPEYLPPLPHPHCMCFMTHVLTEPGEVRPDPTEPRLITENMAKRILRRVHREGDRSLTDRFMQTTAKQINDTSKRMIELHG